MIEQTACWPSKGITLNVVDIPFIHYIEMEEKSSQLSLEYKNSVLNHVRTIHAAAQFALAETQSGIHLQNLFPELEGKVLPIIRDGQIKYKKPAKGKIFAFSSTEEEEVDRFESRLAKRGRVSLQIRVEIRDIDCILISEAIFTWFVQML